MNNEKRPKWPKSDAVTYGGETVALTEKNFSELSSRLMPNEFEELKSNLELLKNERLPGQQEKLSDQKSKTKSQDEVRSMLHISVIDVRNIVKAANAPANIQKSFGVGETLIKTVASTISAAKVVIQGYNNNKDWANRAGIIDEDITEMSTLINDLSSIDGLQENAKIARQGATLDKDVLQRSIEDSVSKISALGAKVFRTKNPAVARLFENLIPPSHRPAKKEKGEEAV